jgi:hypothetical protein
MLKARADDAIGKEPLAVDLWPTTGQLLGLSKNPTYAAAKAGHIPTVRIGKLLKVPYWYIKQLRGEIPVKAA